MSLEGSWLLWFGVSWLLRLRISGLDDVGWLLRLLLNHRHSAHVPDTRTAQPRLKSPDENGESVSSGTDKAEEAASCSDDMDGESGEDDVDEGESDVDDQKCLQTGNVNVVVGVKVVVGCVEAEQSHEGESVDDVGEDLEPLDPI